MKKKIMTGMMVGLISTSIIACGGSGKSTETQKTTQAVETAQETVAETQEETVVETKVEETGEIVDNADMLKIPVYTRKELNLTGESGPITYCIEGIQVSKLTFKSESTASLVGIEAGKEITCIAFNLSAENTSEDTINFYLGQATLVSNTKEQVDPDMFLSDYIEGEYLGQVIHSGTSIYLLENSNADDITNVKLHISAPSDSSFQDIGEDIVVDINLE